MLAKALIGIATAVQFAELTPKESKHFLIETEDNGEIDQGRGAEDNVDSEDQGLSQLHNHGRQRALLRFCKFF